ncbi:hypothetical protein D3C73_1021010 [compost metagenome]
MDSLAVALGEIVVPGELEPPVPAAPPVPDPSGVDPEVPGVPCAGVPGVLPLLFPLTDSIICSFREFCSTSSGI